MHALDGGRCVERRFGRNGEQRRALDNQKRPKSLSPAEQSVTNGLRETLGHAARRAQAPDLGVNMVFEALIHEPRDVREPLRESHEGLT